MNWAELHPRRFFLDTWREMDREARAQRRERITRGDGYDWRPMFALLMGCVFLVAMEYWGSSRVLEGWLRERGAPEWARALRDSDWHYLALHGWWAGWRVLGYFLLPCVVIKLYGGRIRDQGLATKGFREHAAVYLLGYVVVLLCVVVVSNFGEFNEYYPFYRVRPYTHGQGASRSWVDFASWELMYAAQFFSLEFFFRGWWLRACKSTMGSHAIFVMIVPYVMIHFGKPMLETFGAILAGLFLGTLAMRTRSIWWGFIIHVSVAISMDLAALIQTRGLPTTLWPQ